MLWIFLGLTALWMALRYLPAGADRHRPLVELIALIDLLSAPLLVLLVWAILIQAWPQTALALVELTLVSVWRLQYRLHIPSPADSGRSRGHGHATSQAPGTDAGPDTGAVPDAADPGSGAGHEADPGASLTVMTLNCRYGKADPQSIMDKVRAHQVDLLALQEVNSSLLEGLRSVGLEATLPYLVEGPRTDTDNGGRNALFSRTRPVASQPAGMDLEASAVPLMVVGTTAGTVRLASVHPRSPQRGARQWGLGIERLALLNGSRRPLTPGPSPEDAAMQEPAFTIILGDCNANLHHPTFRAMLAAGGLRDASLSLGRGLHPTFPYRLVGLPPMIEIDHILISQGIRVESMRTIGVPGTDHRGLVAHLDLT